MSPKGEEVLGTPPESAVYTAELEYADGRHYTIQGVSDMVFESLFDSVPDKSFYLDLTDGAAVFDGAGLLSVFVRKGFR